MPDDHFLQPNEQQRWHTGFDEEEVLTPWRAHSLLQTPFPMTRDFDQYLDERQPSLPLSCILQDVFPQTEGSKEGFQTSIETQTSDANARPSLRLDTMSWCLETLPAILKPADSGGMLENGASLAAVQNCSPFDDKQALPLPGDSLNSSSWLTETSDDGNEADCMPITSSALDYTAVGAHSGPALLQELGISDAPGGSCFGYVDIASCTVSRAEGTPQLTEATIEQTHLDLRVPNNYSRTIKKSHDASSPVLEWLQLAHPLANSLSRSFDFCYDDSPDEFLGIPHVDPEIHACSSANLLEPSHHTPHQLLQGSHEPLKEWEGSGSKAPAMAAALMCMPAIGNMRGGFSRKRACPESSSSGSDSATFSGSGCGSGISTCFTMRPRPLTASQPPQPTDDELRASITALQNGTSPLLHRPSSDVAAASRASCLERYREKKLRRLECPTIRYMKRKINADARPRYKGRFVKAEDLHLFKQGLLDGHKCASTIPKKIQVSKQLF